MGKLYLLFATALLWVNSVIAQDVFLFTWHGDSNYFHATFEVTHDELMSGSNFSSELFLNSLAVTNPAGNTYFGHDYDHPSSSYIPWSLNAYLYDWQRYTMLALNGGYFVGSEYRTAGLVYEEDLSTYQHFWQEQGYWSVAQVPEPSPIGIAALGVSLAFARYFFRKSTF
jgi:hypothetical protein